MPEFLEVLFGDSVQVKVIYYGTLAAIASIIAWLLYRKFAPGPRRRRALKGVRQTLSNGSWAEALKQLALVRNIGKPSARWQRRFDLVEAECLEQAQAAALLDKDFDRALDYAARVARIRELPPLDSALQIQNLMLAELRRLFSIPGESRSVIDLGQRILQVHSPCREAVFWKGMAHLRGGEPDKALECFLMARGGDGKSVAWLISATTLASMLTLPFWAAWVA